MISYNNDILLSYIIIVIIISYNNNYYYPAFQSISSFNVENATRLFLGLHISVTLYWTVPRMIAVQSWTQQ